MCVIVSCDVFGCVCDVYCVMCGCDVCGCVLCGWYVVGVMCVVVCCVGGMLCVCVWLCVVWVVCCVGGMLCDVRCVAMCCVTSVFVCV